MNHMRALPVRILLGAVAAIALVQPAGAEVRPFPRNFHTENISTDGATIYVRVGGSGSAVVMLHGFADTGDMWVPLASAMMKDHTVIVPDLRGMGLSSHPEAGYDKKTQARDIAAIMDKLNVQKADLVTHDIGNMVGYASRRNIPTASPNGRSSMRRCPESARGRKSSKARCCGISISADPTSTGW
jgi:hypothetical protein